jgi:4-hydroxyisophthalate hydroxylase
LILIRPDQFVAWASRDSSADGAEVLKRTVGAG